MTIIIDGIEYIPSTNDENLVKLKEYKKNWYMSMILSTVIILTLILGGFYVTYNVEYIKTSSCEICENKGFNCVQDTLPYYSGFEIDFNELEEVTNND